MNKTPHHPDQWDACPAGELEQVAQQMRSQRRVRTLAQLSAPAAVLVLALVVGGVVVQQIRNSTDPAVGDITCAKVRLLMDDYIAGKLSGPLANQVKAHVEKCPHCSALYKKMTRSRMGQSAYRPIVIALRHNDRRHRTLLASAGAPRH